MTALQEVFLTERMETCLRLLDFEKSTWTTQESEAFSARNTTREWLTQGWRADRVGSFIPGRPEEIGSAVDMECQVMKHRPARRFRELLASPGIIRSLGAHDVLTALIVEESGFETVFIGGFGTSASLLGLPDLDFLGASQMADAVRRMAARVSIPVIADGDTGHGDLHNVRHTVEMFEAAGAAGILI